MTSRSKNHVFEPWMQLRLEEALERRAERERCERLGIKMTRSRRRVYDEWDELFESYFDDSMNYWGDI